MDPRYAREYRELYEHHWWWRTREKLIVETLCRLQPPGGWRSGVLDVGCGDGLFFDELAQFGDVEGVEMDGSLISDESARTKHIHIGPFDDSFQPGKRYSLVVMLDVLEHLPAPIDALRQVMTLLEPRGTLLVTVPAFNLIWTTHDDVNEHLARYTKSSFRRLARQAGVRIERMRYFFHWTFFAKILVHLMESVRRPTPTPPSIPPRWINETLKLFSRAEQKTLGALPVPFGSSLMIVAGHPQPDTR